MPPGGSLRDRRPERSKAYDHQTRPPLNSVHTWRCARADVRFGEGGDGAIIHCGRARRTAGRSSNRGGPAVGERRVMNFAIGMRRCSRAPLSAMGQELQADTAVHETRHRQDLVTPFTWSGFGHFNSGFRGARMRHERPMWRRRLEWLN